MCKEIKFKKWFDDNKSDCSLHEEFKSYLEVMNDLNEPPLEFKDWAEIYFDSMYE